MKEIKLFNREEADMRLIKSNKWWSNKWKLEVDDRHEYCLQYCRLIYNEDSTTIQAIDPSGGPFISIGDIYEGKYKIVGFDMSEPGISVIIDEGNYN